MSLPPLLKIPLLLGVAWTYQISSTPPNRPPPSSKAPAPSGSNILLRWLEPLLGISIGITWIVALSEIAVILAQHSPSSPITSGILGVLIPRETAPTLPIALAVPFTLGSLLAISGGVLRYWCYQTLGRFFTFKMRIQRDHRLITQGPYSFVRHPSYTGSLLCFIGVSICMISRGSWLRESGVAEYRVVQIVIALNMAFLALVGAGLTFRTYAEDAMMRKEFGKEWDEWARRVSYRVLPGVF
ncbi:hypothetical protein JAAARDRAFT_211203 [Jaapia argillacea MUCL 33604]|uniref:Protein-S-isoprenylcysteine O-methyltransferase n=1 Tax=Jaapia argillacea MUCL 33604 TaxID=933084 RepID=A0A067PLA0_9AGAM|nr:hypothetical protein JAAARDRAFT_211203 [Jaapia argillacea MUCL 33604]